MSSEPSRSSESRLSRAIDAIGAAVSAAVVEVSALNPVVLVDGRSGAGKTSLAHVLVARWPLRGRVQLVSLDSLYPGWSGLAEGVDAARESILVPHARGLIGVWQRWDWEDEAYAEAHAVDPALPLIVEGCGILTAATARLGDVRVWLESPETSRRSRALDRDGDAYRPHWQRWADQESAHIAHDDPTRWATHVFAVP